MTYNAIIFTDSTDTVLVQKPLGAFKLAHELRKAGYSCLVVDHFHTWTQNEIFQLLEQTMDHSTFFVGVSTTFLMNTDVVQTGHVSYSHFNANLSFCPQGKTFENSFVEKIKLLNPKCKIVAGGHRTKENCNNKNIDIIVKGYAEKSIVTLIKNLQDEVPLENSVKNIWGINTIQPPINDEQYDFAHGGMHWEYTDVVNSRILPIESARGCIFNCKFCSFPMRGKKTLEYVLNSELMYREFQDNFDLYGITDYWLMDDTFNDSDEKLDSILSVVKRLSFQPHFWAYARLDLMAVKPHRMKKMFDIGVRSVFLGIETLDKKAGEIVGKGFDPEKKIKTIQDIRKTYGNDFLMHGSFIVGLPGESLEQVTNTYEMIADQRIPLHSANFKPLRIARDASAIWYSSEFDRNWKEYGYEIDETIATSSSEDINWKNQHMNQATAIKSAQKFNESLLNNNNLYLGGHTSWTLMNYPEFSYDRVKNLKFTDIDWHEVTQSKIKFVDIYKQKLFNSLNTRQCS